MSESRSEWASLRGVKEVSLRPLSEPVRGSIRLPGSKSFTNRSIIIAASARGTSHITGALRSDDSYWCIESLRQLGIEIEDNGSRLRIEGSPEWGAARAPLFIGSAGTTARFLTSLIA